MIQEPVHLEGQGWPGLAAAHSHAHDRVTRGPLSDADPQAGDKEGSWENRMEWKAGGGEIYASKGQALRKK